MSPMSPMRPSLPRILRAGLVPGLVLGLALAGARPAAAGCLSGSSFTCQQLFHISAKVEPFLPIWVISVSPRSPHRMVCSMRQCTKNLNNFSIDEFIQAPAQVGDNISFNYPKHFPLGCPQQIWAYETIFTSGFSIFRFKAQFKENGGTRKKKSCVLVLPAIDQVQFTEYEDLPIFDEPEDPSDPF